MDITETKFERLVNHIGELRQDYEREIESYRDAIKAMIDEHFDLIIKGLNEKLVLVDDSIEKYIADFKKIKLKKKELDNLKLSLNPLVSNINHKSTNQV